MRPPASCVVCRLHFCSASHAHFHEPGGFRRNYVLLQSNGAPQDDRRVLRNFIDFLYILGHFAGGDLEEIDEGDEEEEDEEAAYGSPSIHARRHFTLEGQEDGRGPSVHIDTAGLPLSMPTDTEHTPLLDRAKSRSLSRRRRGSVAHGDATVHGSGNSDVVYVTPPRAEGGFRGHIMRRVQKLRMISTSASALHAAARELRRLQAPLLQCQGGFRRNYVLLQFNGAPQDDRRVLRNFIDFLLEETWKKLTKGTRRKRTRKLHMGLRRFTLDALLHWRVKKTTRVYLSTLILQDYRYQCPQIPSTHRYWTAPNRGRFRGAGAAALLTGTPLYMGQAILMNLQAFVVGVTHCATYILVPYLIVMEVVVFLTLALIRNLAKLSTTALVADAFILMYIFSSEFAIIAQRGIAKVDLFNPKGFPLLIGTAVFSFEGIGLVCVLRMTQECVMSSFSSYADIKTVVLVSSLVDSTSSLTQAVQFLYSLAIMLS
ncbi:hypothetical protein FA95DRAFT_1613065, partial [Auriscalpium vulgare]